MLYLITIGNYSDYRIGAILRHPGWQDIGQLLVDFGIATGVERRTADDVWEWDVEESPKLAEWSLRLSVSRVDGRNKICYGSWCDVFLAWLVQTRGFERLEYVETNLDYKYD